MTEVRQKRRTAGLDDTMSRPGPAARAVQAVVERAEELNLRCSAVDNPPVYANDVLPWSREIEAEWWRIRRELDGIMQWKDALPAFHQIASYVSAISADQSWKTFLLCGYGRRSEEAIRRCPETWRSLRKVPGLKSAMFSIFEPGKHLAPHRGPYNGVLRFHLGLIVPERADRVGIRIADEVHRRREGEALIFDDAYEHEAWNHSEEVRVVVFVDVEKPTRFPARPTNKAVLELALFTPFVREGYQAQKAWEKLAYGAEPSSR